jgi:hypothetical protein
MHQDSFLSIRPSLALTSWNPKWRSPVAGVFDLGHEDYDIGSLQMLSTLMNIRCFLTP